MRTIPMLLLLLMALSAGCATGPSFNRLQSDPSGASTSVNPVAVEPEEGVSRDGQPDADMTTASAKVRAAIRQTGRVIKCGAIGAVAGLVVIPLILVKTGGATSGVAGNPAPWAAFALLGMAGGVVAAFQEPKPEIC